MTTRLGKALAAANALPAAQVKRGVRARLGGWRQVALAATVVAIAAALVSECLTLVIHARVAYGDATRHLRLINGYLWLPLAVEAVFALLELARARRPGWRPLVIVVHLLVALECVVVVPMAAAADAGVARDLVLGGHAAVLAVMIARGLAMSARVSLTDAPVPGAVHGAPIAAAGEDDGAE